MIDYFSKWAEAYALSHHKAETVADCNVNRWISHHGIPIRIHSDNTPEFRGHVITQLKKMLSMEGTFTTPYRPQSNGSCERMNQTIENIIKCTVRYEYLGQVTRSCNDGFSSYSPDINSIQPQYVGDREGDKHAC